MLKLDEIKASIESLPEDEFVQIRQWFSEKDWQKWDEQIKDDSEGGEIEGPLDASNNESFPEVLCETPISNSEDCRKELPPLKGESQTSLIAFQESWQAMVSQDRK